MTDIQSALAPVKAYIFVSRSANSGAYFLAEVGVAKTCTGGGLVILVLTCSKWRPPLLKRAGATTM